MNMTHILNQTKFVLMKNAPKILTGAAIAGFGITIYTVHKNAPKANEIVRVAKEKAAEIKQNVKEGEDPRKEVFNNYAKMTLDLAKLYAGTAAAATGTVASIIGVHNILAGRNAALAAAYAAASKAFTAYRDRVRDTYGEEEEERLYFNAEKTEKEVTLIDEETGKKKRVKKTEVGKPSLKDAMSMYGRIFEEGSSECWQPVHDLNRMFLKSQLQSANDILNARGYIFLNEVYAMLGMPKTKSGAVVGWVKNTKDETRDNYVSFGLNSIVNKDFFEDNESINAAILDFNVDGYILDDLVEQHHYADK